VHAPAPSPLPWKMKPFAFIRNNIKYLRDPTIIFIHLTNLIDLIV
jgi:hypothetical protein